MESSLGLRYLTEITLHHEQEVDEDLCEECGHGPDLPIKMDQQYLGQQLRNVRDDLNQTF